MFHEIEKIIKINGSCLENVDVIPLQNCPESEMNCEFNPIIVYPNYIGVKLLQCGGYEEETIFLANKSEKCILFNWNKYIRHMISCTTE